MIKVDAGKVVTRVEAGNVDAGSVVTIVDAGCVLTTVAYWVLTMVVYEMLSDTEVTVVPGAVETIVWLIVTGYLSKEEKVSR